MKIGNKHQVASVTLAEAILVLAAIITGLMSGVAHAALQAMQTPSAAGTAPCGPAGKHALLERMTVAFGLSCSQKFQIEPLLHNEESVSKPLLRFAAFTPEEKKAVIREVKVAARRRIRPLLTPGQQQKMDREIATVSSGGEGLQGRKGKRSGPPKTIAINAHPFDAEESLSRAIEDYSALSSNQKRELLQKVKQAALEKSDPPLTAEQARKIDAALEHLSLGSQ